MLSLAGVSLIDSALDSPASLSVFDCVLLSSDTSLLLSSSEAAAEDVTEAEELPVLAVLSVHPAPTQAIIAARKFLKLSDEEIQKGLSTFQGTAGRMDIVAKVNGKGEFGETLSSPSIGAPNVGCSATFLCIGNFKTEYEANAVLKYISSKFARTMLATLKVTQNNARDAWQNIPIQNFTDHSDIDWSKSLSEIDSQLYKKYGLSNDEIDFIEKNVQPME